MKNEKKKEIGKCKITKMNIVVKPEERPKLVRTKFVGKEHSWWANGCVIDRWQDNVSISWSNQIDRDASIVPFGLSIFDILQMNRICWIVIVIRLIIITINQPCWNTEMNMWLLLGQQKKKEKTENKNW